MTKHPAGLAATAFLLSMACSGGEPPQPAPPPVHHREDQAPWFHLRDADPTTSAWGKQPANMLRLHATFAAFGYERLVPGRDLEGASFLIHEVYVRQPLGALLSDLALGPDEAEAGAWSRAFWERRRIEGNADAALTVVRDVKAALVDGQAPTVDRARVDPLLLELLELEHTPKPAGDRHPEDTTHEHARRLRELGLHASARNLIMGERYGYEALDHDERQAFLGTLDTQPEPPPVIWFGDDTK